MAIDAVGSEQREPRGDGRRRAGEGVRHPRGAVRDRAVEREGGEPFLEPSRRFRGGEVDEPGRQGDAGAKNGERREQKQLAEGPHIYSTTTVSFMLPCPAPQK